MLWGTRTRTIIIMAFLLLLVVGSISRRGAVAAAKQQRDIAFVGAAGGSAATGFINHNSRRRRRRRSSSFPRRANFSTTPSTCRGTTFFASATTTSSSRSRRRCCSCYSSSSSSPSSSSVHDERTATPSSTTGGTRAVSGTEKRPRRRYLVVGDGDLSYSASIAPKLAMDNIQLIATVLENQESHHETYANSRDCTSTILEATPGEAVDGANDGEAGDNGDGGGEANDAAEEPHHQVRFGIDATRLEHYFLDNQKFDRIVFNFPHWSGKSNNKYNRKLIDKFFKSASQLLLRRATDGDERDSSGCGEIHVALCEGQGGYDKATKTIQDYRQSWKVAELAAQHGLMLLRTQPFDDASSKYNLSSYREKDQPFRIGQNPAQYVFGFPTASNTPTNSNLQVSCRHELRIVLPDEPKPEEEVFGDAETIEAAVFWLAKGVAPPGIRVEIPIRNVIAIDGGTGKQRLLVFLMVYSGEAMPLTRNLADQLRSNIETSVEAQLKFDIAKRDRMVSTPFPYHLLSKILQGYSP